MRQASLALLGAALFASLAASGCLDPRDPLADAASAADLDATRDAAMAGEQSASDVAPDESGGDTSIDSTRDSSVADSSADGVLPDGSADSVSPDSTADTISPDSTVDTFSPDSTVDTLSPDSTVDAGGPCDQSCTVTFTLARQGSESRADLYGNFSGPSSSSRTMSLSGNSWTLSVTLPNAHVFTYRFVLDQGAASETWLDDPSNPEKGAGGIGSVYVNHCSKHCCARGLAGSSCGQCEIGYSGSSCDQCVAGYARIAGSCLRAPSCRASNSWLIDGSLPPDQHAGASSFQILGTTAEPVVRDRFSGLQWRRCAAGMSWNVTSGSCTGTATLYRLDSANSACTGSWGGYSDWRAPELSEIESVMNYASAQPTMDTSTFPGLPVSQTGALATATGEPASTRVVNSVVLDRGQSWYDNAPVKSAVLCVRGGRSDVARPRFVVEADDGSTVKDLWTGQIWRRCPLGLSWNAATSTCSGVQLVAPYAQMTAACSAMGSGWRIPSARELRAVRSYCTKPALDAAAFPPAPTQSRYFTATQLWQDPSVFQVRISDVYVSLASKSGSFGATCVR